MAYWLMHYNAYITSDIVQHRFDSQNSDVGISTISIIVLEIAEVLQVWAAIAINRSLKILGHEKT